MAVVDGWCLPATAFYVYISLWSEPLQPSDRFAPLLGIGRFENVSPVDRGEANGGFTWLGPSVYWTMCCHVAGTALVYAPAPASLRRRVSVALTAGTWQPGSPQ